MAAITVHWPTDRGDPSCAQLLPVVRAVTALGGAIGWLVPPDREELDRWLDPVMAEVAAGAAALCVVGVDGTVRAMGAWRRDPGSVYPHRATLTKIMAHPDARGLGLGRVVTAALVDHARAAGMETLHLGVRGNNHLAIALYASLGFVEWGRIPDSIEVGHLRFDDVQMYLQFPAPPGVVRCGSAPEGPGSSPPPAR